MAPQKQRLCCDKLDHRKDRRIFGGMRPWIVLLCWLASWDHRPTFVSCRSQLQIRLLSDVPEGLLNVSMPGSSYGPTPAALTVTAMTKVRLPNGLGFDNTTSSADSTAAQLQTTLRKLTQGCWLPGPGNVSMSVDGWIVQLWLNVTVPSTNSSWPWSASSSTPPPSPAWSQSPAQPHQALVPMSGTLPSSCAQPSLDALASLLNVCGGGKNITLQCMEKADATGSPAWLWDSCSTTPGRMVVSVMFPDTCSLETMTAVLPAVIRAFATNHSDNICALAPQNMALAFQVNAQYSFSVATVLDWSSMTRACQYVQSQTPSAIQSMIQGPMVWSGGSQATLVDQPQSVCTVQPTGSPTPSDSGGGSSVNVVAIVVGCVVGGVALMGMVGGGYYTYKRVQGRQPFDKGPGQAGAAGFGGQGSSGLGQGPQPSAASGGQGVPLFSWTSQAQGREVAAAAAAQSMNQSYKAMQMAAILGSAAEQPQKYSAAAARKARLKAAKAAEQGGNGNGQGQCAGGSSAALPNLAPAASGSLPLSSPSGSMFSWASSNVVSSGRSSGAGSLVPAAPQPQPLAGPPHPQQVSQVYTHTSGMVPALTHGSLPPQATAAAAVTQLKVLPAMAAPAPAPPAPAAAQQQFTHSHVITTAGPVFTPSPAAAAPAMAPPPAAAAPQRTSVLDLGGPLGGPGGPKGPKASVLDLGGIAGVSQGMRQAKAISDGATSSMWGGMPAAAVPATAGGSPLWSASDPASQPAGSGGSSGAVVSRGSNDPAPSGGSNGRVCSGGSEGPGGSHGQSLVGASAVAGGRVSQSNTPLGPHISSPASPYSCSQEEVMNIISAIEGGSDSPTIHPSFLGQGSDGSPTFPRVDEEAFSAMGPTGNRGAGGFGGVPADDGPYADLSVLCAPSSPEVDEILSMLEDAGPEVSAPGEVSSVYQATQTAELSAYTFGPDAHVAAGSGDAGDAARMFQFWAHEEGPDPMVADVRGQGQGQGQQAEQRQGQKQKRPLGVDYEDGHDGKRQAGSWRQQFQDALGQFYVALKQHKQGEAPELPPQQAGQMTQQFSLPQDRRRQQLPGQVMQQYTQQQQLGLAMQHYPQQPQQQQW